MPLRNTFPLRLCRDAGAYLRASVLRGLVKFLVVVLPLVWLLVAHERIQLGNIARDESNRNVKNLAHTFAEEVRSSIITINLSLSQLRLSWLHNPEQFGAIAAELNTHLQGQLLINFIVTDPLGKVLYASLPNGSEQVSLGDRDYVRAHLKEQAGDHLFIGKPLRGRLSGRQTVQFSRPIHDKDGKLVAVIIAGVAPGYFSRFYGTIDLGADASIALVRFDGIVVVRTTQNLAVRDSGKRLASFPFAPGNKAGGSFMRVSRLDGVERHYGWRTLPEYGLAVTVGQSVLDASARYAQQKQLLVYVGLTVSLLLVLVGWAAIAAADQRRRGVASLAAAEARWKLALNAAGEGVWDYSFESGLVTLSPSAQGIVDAPGTLLPFDRTVFAAMAHPEDTVAVLLALDAHLDGTAPDYTAQYRTRLSKGNWRWILVRGQVAARGSRGQPLRIVGTVADIDARKLQEDQIRHLAHHDMLTGLPNRLLFGDRLRQALLAARREAHQLAVIFFDLDKFKPVNDSYGHAVGDVLLQQIATRLRGMLRASDTLARLGGDEFVVLLPQVTGADDARKVAEDILRELSRPFMTEGFSLSISASLGVAVYPDCAPDTEGLLRCADAAMYEAKLHGGRRVAEHAASDPGPAAPPPMRHAA
jgi:diguanylate cyclase (GGDEF)-like protein